jgi:HTH-type transcriptional regulator/antitoxin HigA
MLASKQAKIDHDYLELVRQFPLIPIRSESCFKEAMKVIDELSVIVEGKLKPGQSDYLMVLTDLVEKYEDAHCPLEEGFDDGVEALKYLLDQREMTASDLGRLLGNRQMGAAILRRSRQLSKANLLKLAAHFNVTADLLLREGPVRKRRAS